MQLAQGLWQARVHVNEPSVFIKRGELLTIKILPFDSQDVLCLLCLVATPLIEVTVLNCWGSGKLRKQTRTITMAS